MKKKPPIGLMPKDIWMENRFNNVCGAITRYYTAGLIIPIRWVVEYNTWIKLFNDRRKK